MFYTVYILIVLTYIVKMCHKIMYAWPNSPACMGVELLKNMKKLYVREFQGSFCNQDHGFSGALVNGYQHLEGTCCILPERWRQQFQSHLVPSYQIVWCHISYIHNRNTHHCENLKSEYLLMCNEICCLNYQEVFFVIS
jgi:hypothetical protein